MDPNYDFSGVYNESSYVIFRSRQFFTANYAERSETKGRFESIRIQLHQESKYKELNTAKEIVYATLDGKNLVGRTIFFRRDEEIVLEYPIKTINVNSQSWIY